MGKLKGYTAWQEYNGAPLYVSASPPKRGDYAWIYDAQTQTWYKRQFADPSDWPDINKTFQNKGLDIVGGGLGGLITLDSASSETFEQWRYEDLGSYLRPPNTPLGEGWYQDPRTGKEITAEQAAAIDAKQHPELLQDPDFLAEHPELTPPPSYAEYGMVALGILAIGGIIYIAYKAFRVKK